MALNKGEAYKLLLFIIQHAPYDKISASVAYCVFEALRKRKELPSNARSFVQDQLEDSMDSLKTFNKAIKILETYSEEDLNDFVFYTNTYLSEFGGKLSESINNGVSQLALRLLQIKDNDTIFDLGCGNGSFLLSANRYCFDNKVKNTKLIGVDIDYNQINLTKANLALCGANSFETDVLDVFYDYPEDAYNKGYVFPPINMKKTYGNSFSYLVDKNISMSSEWIFVDRLLKQLKGENKRAVAVLHAKPLFNENDREFRNALLDMGLIESIIELPSGAFNFTTIRPVVVVFSENNKEVNIVDASKVCEKEFRKYARFELPYEKVLSLLDGCAKKPIDELKEAHSLVPTSLLAAECVKIDGTQLSEFADVFTGAQYTNANFEKFFKDDSTGRRILTSSDIVDGTADWNHLQSVELPDDKFDKYAVQKNDIVMTAKSSKVKTVVIDFEPKDKIIVTGGMLIIRPKEDLINPTFLKVFLDSVGGHAQLKMIQKGSVIITINAKDLKTITIPNVSKEKQAAIAKQYNFTLASYISLKRELKEIEEKLKNINIEGDLD